MTLQTKGFQWSIGIHGLFFLAALVLQAFAVSQSKVTVIDFSLNDQLTSPAAQSVSSDQTPTAKHKEESARALPPKEAVVKQRVPIREAEKAALPSQMSVQGKEIPASLPQAAGGSGTPSTNGAFRETAYGAGSAQSSAGGSGNARAGESQGKSQAAYLKEHFIYIRDKIIKGTSYPHMARKMGWCGQVKIAFVVREDGRVNDVRVVDSSGFGVLDRNAVDTVKNVAPFPRPPVSAEIRMAITYRLN